MCRYKCTSKLKCRNTTTTTTTTIEAFFSLSAALIIVDISLSSRNTKKSQCNFFVLYSCEYIFTPWTWSLKSRRVCRHAMKKKKKKICNWKRPTLTGQKKNCINALFQRRQKTFNVCFHKRQSTLSLKKHFMNFLQLWKFNNELRGNLNWQQESLHLRLEEKPCCKTT